MKKKINFKSCTIFSFQEPYTLFSTTQYAFPLAIMIMESINQDLAI